ncbi:MAG: hypothetical protein PHN47_03800 [Clostridia bacterium]|nr:hypothetical protein [Clostridia bacterium]MDD4571591.1 hypothetical protein [Clostridia bacterium]
MKKIMSIIMSFVMILAFSSIAMASDVDFDINRIEQGQVVYEQNEITDEDQLYERAQNGISDIPLEQLQNPQINFTPVQENKAKSLLPDPKTESNATAQIISKRILDDGTIVDEVVVTQFTDIYLPKESVIQPCLIYEDPSWDDTSSVRLTGTLTFYKATHSGVTEFYLLSKVAGRWDIVSDNPTVSNRLIVAYCCGQSDLDYLLHQEDSYYPGTNSFSYVTGFTHYVYKHAGSMGFNAKATLKRGTSSWTMDVGCFLFGNYHLW